ncbi:MAG: response regulator, partial [Gemmatimonadales bacterium]|nr:response regulator [Gemmatimonadales bacterium]
VFPGFESTPLHATLQQTLVDRKVQQVDLEFTFPDGSTGWFQLHFEPVADGAFVLSVEITERVRAQRSLERSESRYRALLSGLPDLVFLLDSAGVVLDLHAPDGVRLPKPPAQLLGHPLIASLPPVPAAQVGAALRRVGQSRLPETVSYELPIAHGAQYLEATIVPTDDERLTMVVRDLTSRQNLEQQLRQAQKMEAVGQLTGGIAHDFNNVLTIIGANAEMLAASAPAGTEARLETDEILRATGRGAEMISRLLKFSRRGPLDRQSLDPAELVPDIVAMLEPLLPAYIQLEVGVLEPTRVSLDPGALEQVLTNLCTNARDAMPKGGTIQLECATTWLDAGYRATHPWVKPGEYVCLSVSDTGDGMDEATRFRVFEPFFTTKPAGIGTGLGLSMVYGIMKDHDGMVHVYSEPGQGTVVKLYFPAVTDAAVEAAPVRSSDVQLVQGGGELLLLAEDDPAIRLATRRALEGKQYRVVEAADGEEALAVYQQHRGAIALIISDLVMPNLGGRQLVEALRADGVTVPVLFTSGYSRDTVYRVPLPLDGVSFLHKPWTLAELLTAVRQQLGGAPGGVAESTGCLQVAASPTGPAHCLPLTAHRLP